MSEGRKLLYRCGGGSRGGIWRRSGLHASPLLVLTFALTCCVPWSCTEGAADGGWFLNFRIPFQKSILVTAQHQYNNQNFYMIVRGGTNVPLNFGGVRLWCGALCQRSLWLYWCEGWSTSDYERRGGRACVWSTTRAQDVKRGVVILGCGVRVVHCCPASSRSPRLLG